MIEVLNTIEDIAKEKKIDINKLKSEHYIKYKSRLLDEDFHDLLFIYITYLKEDLASLLQVEKARKCFFQYFTYIYGKIKQGVVL